MPWLLLLACAAPTPPAAPIPVRGGWVVAGGDDGRPLAAGRRWVERPWAPGDRYEGPGGQAVAPRLASCAELFRVPLGDASDAVARGGESPDTALAFSPDGAWLAVGAWTGEVVIVDGWTGVERARTRLSETLVREIAWSPDGAVLYAAEQSPDAFVVALDARDLRVLARYRLADDVGSSPPPPGDDLYGVYSLPAAYALRVLADGDLVVVGTHGWDTDGGRRNASRVLRLRLEGQRFVTVAAWPADGAADAVLGAVDLLDDRLSVAVRRSASGPAPAALPVDGLQHLSVEALLPAGTSRFEPLAPYYASVFVWDALVLRPGVTWVGLGDGRLVALGPDGPEVVPLGVPRLAGDVPIAASVGFARGVGERVFVSTSGTGIPYGAAAPELRPPEAHPEENALHALRWADGAPERLWSWRGPHRLAGLGASDRELVVGAGPRDDGRTDLFGALVFEAAGDGQPSAWCPTEAPVYHRPVITPDGRVAVAEVPWRDGDAVRGTYRVTVFR